MAYSVRITNLQMNLATAFSMDTDYLALSQASIQQSAGKNNLDGKIQAIKAQQADLDGEIQTYEKEFRDRMDILPASSSLKTLQDLVLAFFFISYFLLAGLVSFEIGRKNMVFGGFTFFLSIIFSVVLVTAIRLYA
uniref:Uncharacterized protein n=1 Tax=viral metagenome TaxID=1070528 RepID=A0A6C0BAQ6_9ZZZZ